MLNLKHLAALAAASFALSLGIANRADAFSFTRIADIPTDPNASWWVAVINYGYPVWFPAINNSGTVAFDDLRLEYIYGKPLHTNFGIAVSNGNGITHVIDTSGPIKSAGLTAINDAGTLAFEAVLDTEERGIFTNSGGTLTPIFMAGTPTPLGIISNYGRSQLNNSGTVVFHGSGGLGDGIFTGSGGALTIIANTNITDADSPFVSFEDFPALNDRGRVAFVADLETGGNGVFTGKGGRITTVASPGSSGLHNFTTPDLNTKGTVAFVADLETGGRGIFTSSGGTITPLITTDGPFIITDGEPSGSEPLKVLTTLDLNNKGKVAFVAELDTGGWGIFTGPDPVADKVIAVGDSLFGSTVAGLSFFRGGFNDKGQVAFLATFTDGKVGIFRADPCRRRNLRHCRQSSYQLSSLRGSLKGQAGVLRAAPEVVPLSKSVPEPSSSAALLTVAMAGVATLRQRAGT